MGTLQSKGGATISVGENAIGDQSSKPGWGCLHFTGLSSFGLGKGYLNSDPRPL